MRRAREPAAGGTAHPQVVGEHGDRALVGVALLACHDSPRRMHRQARGRISSGPDPFHWRTSYFIETVSEAEAERRLREVYDGDQQTFGYVPNHARVFSLRPDVLQAWRSLRGSIRKNLSPRRYELVTAAAAQALNSRYCLLAHGAVLTHNGVGVDQLRAILTDFHDAGLVPAEAGIMDYAQKIARSANEITQADVDALRALGLEDVEILDVALTATMRCFASKTFDALGAEADPVLDELEGQLSDLLPA